MQLIETKTLATEASSIDFADIPQTFTDIVAVCSLRFSIDAADVSLRLNGSSTGYSMRLLYGTGSSAASANNSSGYFVWSGFATSSTWTASTFGNNQLYFPNYSGNTNKTVSIDGVTENNATLSYQSLTAGLWSNTAAITSMSFSGAASGGGNFVAGSTISLYGIGGAGDGWSPKATGGIIQKVGDYWLHTFTSSGTFTPTENLSNVEYLVIAGGAGGGSNAAGGGGAGGYRSSVTGELSGANSTAESKLSLTSGTNYTVTIGAGGAGAPNSNSKGSNGSNSVFGAITSIGGGGGGSGESRSGASGGSGGGGNGSSVSTTGTNAGGDGTANQGFAGSIGQQRYISFTVFNAPGGGGGAGEIGQIVGGEGGGGRGGNGISSSITGSAVPRAGGGGGGTLSSSGAGGSGGGGTGGMSPTAGASNTGGGGGGHGSNPAGAAGGSGIVIVRYAA